MADSDYWLCDVCGRKSFYDESLNYDTYSLRDDGKRLAYGCGDMQAICRYCAKTHEVIVKQKGTP